MKLEFRPRAKLDLDDAYAWYEAQHPGLGDSFLAEVETALEGIREHPESFAQIERNARRALLRRFPYGVYFVVEDAKVVVFAVYHFKRDPSGWQARL